MGPSYQLLWFEQYLHREPVTKLQPDEYLAIHGADALLLIVKPQLLHA